MKHRRKPTLKERLTPCIVCFHPLSQRHHLLTFSVFGESRMGTIQLCANCHELYHLCERYVRKQRNDEKLRLFEVETEEEKLIGQLVARPGNLPLLRLASAVATIDKLIDGHDRDLEPDQRQVLNSSIAFVMGFKEYVKQEREKDFKKYGMLWNDIVLTGMDKEIGNE